ncbi:MAG: Holliday junction resolvase RuvX [Erysipelotrichaceae bacterium]|nr:Holliday junction resolvase RuvX [Erysipelotrichaceae bacterium]
MSKILGLDLGTKTLGVAITDANQTLALRHEQFNFAIGNYKAAREKVLEIASKENITTIVIGYPLHEKGHKGERCASVDRFISDLEKENPSLNFIRVDERYSSIEANERLLALGYNTFRRKEVVDMWAAQVILETYLARQRKEK